MFTIIWRITKLLLYNSKISALIADRSYTLSGVMLITEKLLFQIHFFKFEYRHIQRFILSIVMAIDAIKVTHWKAKPLADCVFWMEVFFFQVRWKCSHYRQHQIISSFIMKWLSGFHERTSVLCCSMWKHEQIMQHVINDQCIKLVKLK